VDAARSCGSETDRDFSSDRVQKFARLACEKVAVTVRRDSDVKKQVNKHPVMKQGNGPCRVETGS
jgi:hypothetical protein